MGQKRMTYDPRVDQIRFQTWGIPARFCNLTLEDFLPTDGQVEACDAAGFFVKHFNECYVGSCEEKDSVRLGRGLMLEGPPGTGKTTIAMATLLEVYYTHRVRIGFITWPDYIANRIQMIQLESRDDQESITAWLDLNQNLQYLRDAPVIVLDDVGKEHRPPRSGFSNSELDALLRKRHREGKPTIITTNMDRSVWSKEYNETLDSLLYEAVDNVHLNTKDMRRRR
jgi:DNA replication protein DnaC